MEVKTIFLSMEVKTYKHINDTKNGQKEEEDEKRLLSLCNNPTNK